MQLHEAYLSVWEALKHSAIHHGRKLEIVWVDSEEITPATVDERLGDVDGVLVPGGFGMRGIEGKIEAVRYCRENKVPYLGVCLGMQCAVDRVRAQRVRHDRRQLERSSTRRRRTR